MSTYVSFGSYLAQFFWE